MAVPPPVRTTYREDTMNLREIIREELEAAGTRTTVGDVAGKVYARLTADEREQALIETLHEYVRQAISATRHSETDSAQHEGGQRPNRSRKVAAIREHWKRRLEEWYATGAGNRARLVDLTYDELMFNVGTRRQMAAANLAEADTLDRIAQAIRERGVARVGDLPDDVLRSLLDAEDAA